MTKSRKTARSTTRTAETLPSLVLIVDEDLGIKELNGAARAFLGPKHKEALQMRKGDAFNCAHSKESPKGCGRGRFCEICPIREAATLACKEHRVVRRRTKAEIGKAGHRRAAHLLVTATPLPSRGATRILLVLEDISALVQLQDPVPICASCRRMRDDDGFWAQMEDHFRQHFDLDLSHGLCPGCKQQFYGDLKQSQPLFFREKTACVQQA
jgi:hypothetical protein